MEKSKALTKLDELIKVGNDLLQNKEYYNVNSDSYYTRVLVMSPLASGYRVDDKKFSQWQEEIRLFLSYEKFKTSYAEFNKERKNVTNATKTEEYIAILNSLRKGIFDDFIELKKDIELSEITNYSVFIGHGHNLLWARIGLYLSDRLQLKPKYFEDSNRTSKIIPSEIEKFVNRKQTLIVLSLVFAFLVFLWVDQNSDTILNKTAKVLYNQPVEAEYNEEAYVIEGLPKSVDVTLIGRTSDLYLAQQYSSSLSRIIFRASESMTVSAVLPLRQ